MNLDDAPIQRKLTTAILLASAVVLILSAAVFSAHGVITFRRIAENYSLTIARITAAQSALPVETEDKAECQKILSRLNSEPSILLAALYGTDHKMLARYPAAADVRLFPPEPVEREYQIRSEAVLVFVPVRQDDRIVGSLYLKWDLSPEYHRIRWDAGVLALLLLASVGVAWAVSRGLQRRISRPILELAQVAESVSAKHDYSLRAKKFGHDELGGLTDAFNQMMTQIGAQEEELRENGEQLREALESAHASAGEVRTLNSELEQRVARRTSELAAANQELEAFTSSVSHDLRAPLRQIDAFAQLFQEEITRNPQAALEFVTRIRSSAQHMTRLVEGLLDLSRLGQASLQCETIPLRSLVNEAIAELGPEARGRHIDWRIAELPQAKVDPGLIRQVFANLISNAVKYTRPREQAVIEIGVETTPEGKAVFVRDNGAGFDMKSAGKLFRVFQRLHRKEEFEGTGIGLATAQRIIQLHGGKIWFQAELNKGATFFFTLPGLEDSPA
jgi:signal transduction histidine kinase